MSLCRRMAALFALLGAFGLHAESTAQETKSVIESAREIPVAHEVDVVVVGGSTGGVAAAIEAAESGANVILLAPRMYLGEDLCATLRLWLEEGEGIDGELSTKIFAGSRVTTPMRVKKTLETALLQSRVTFLLGCYPTNVLRDASGETAGVVIANRAGRQAIVAKTIIDATDGATVAGFAGAARAARSQTTRVSTRIVLGGEGTSELEPVRQTAAGIRHAGEELDYYTYRIERQNTPDSVNAWAEAEQQARDLTYRDGQLRAAERLWRVPDAAVQGKRAAGQWQRLDSTTLDHFRPRNLDRVYVLSGAADVPRDVAYRLMRPASYERLGRLIGRSAGLAAHKLPAPTGVHVPGTTAASAAAGDVREILGGLRPTAQAAKTVPAGAASVPVLDEVEVLIIGGGTSGACAAIAAARRGADVLVVEYQEGLGGVGTMGLIGRAYHGLNLGFTKEVPFVNQELNTEYKMEWFRREIRKAGGKIWFGALGCGAFVNGDLVRGAVVITPRGRGVVLADVVIDATGNADVAVAAGADAMYGGGSDDIALQGTGLPVRPLDRGYVNTDYLLVDESDAVDVSRAVVGARLTRQGESFDMGTFIQARERRRVVGEHTLRYLDQIAERTYPDTIVLSGSDYDSHGYPTEPYFALIPHTEKTLKANHPAPGGTCFTPYRCLLPRGLQGILVTGLGISMHRDASAMVRMQKDMHNQGYAAGVAATMAVQERCTPRQIDIKVLQKHLVEIGNLPEHVLSDRDSFPLPDATIQAAVVDWADSNQNREVRCKALALILSHPTQARPYLQESHASAEGAVRLEYAKLLGFLGERAVVPELIEALNRVTAWDPKILQGKMAEYAHLPTPVDALILALGYTQDRRATAVLVERLEQLDPQVTLSHHRALALALEQIADPASAEPLALLLSKPGMRGHVMTQIEPLHDRDLDKRRRIGPLREIVLARALYHCGDYGGLGESILTEYQGDIRGLFARHATAVLTPTPEGSN